MLGLGFEVREEATVEAITEEVQKSSEIEGELLDRAAVRSSVARRLGLSTASALPEDRYIDGVVDILLDATGKYQSPLTAARLFGWHAAMFPVGYSGLRRITVGNWRTDSDGPMRVVSGRQGREQVHFEAPPALQLPGEMDAFFKWFEVSDECDPVLKAAIAHLWFVTIHPFDDGNGRISRAITDLMLTRSENSAQRFYSMSAQIRKERSSYYDHLEVVQRGALDVTDWIVWFLGCLDRAIIGAQDILDAVLRKARWWEAHSVVPINERQRLMLNKLIDGFTGNLTTAKWAAISKCSHDTALRDIHDLLQKGVLAASQSGGRSTSYSLSESV